MVSGAPESADGCDHSARSDVGGAVAGNQIEKRAGSNTSTAYRVNVRLDDGRVATVTQSNIGNLRVGDRARVANDMATAY